MQDCQDARVMRFLRSGFLFSLEKTASPSLLFCLTQPLMLRCTQIESGRCIYPLAQHSSCLFPSMCITGNAAQSYTFLSFFWLSYISAKNVGRIIKSTDFIASEMFMGHSVCKSLHIWIQSEESPTFSYAHFLSYRLRAGAKNSLKRLLCNWQALRATSFSRGRIVASGACLCVRNVIKSRFQNKTGAYRNFFFFIQKLLNFEANLTVWAVWALRQQSCQKRKEKKEEGWRTGTTAMWRGTTLLGKNSSIPCRVQSALSRHAEAGAVLPELPPVVRDEDEEEEEESRATCRFRLHTWKQWLWFLLR